MDSDGETTTREGADTPRAAAERDPAHPRRVLLAAYPGGRPTGALLRAHLWSDAALPRSLPRHRILVRRGDFESIAVDVAEEIGIAEEVADGTAAAVVESTRRSVLVLPFSEADAA